MLIFKTVAERSRMDGETPKTQNKPKTKPNKANFLEVKPHSKRKNGDFRQI